MNKRITFVTSEPQVDAIDRWRARQRPIPTRNDAIRQIIDRGLEALAKDEEGAGE